MVQQITPDELAKRLRSGETIFLLDVRQPWEHEIVALAASRLIPLNELPERLDEVDPPKGVPVVVYCHHGIRSLTGAALLEQAGHREVYSLAGGIDLWSQLVDPSLPRY
jgi:adenylyltransferase/sulfurtransferase